MSKPECAWCGNPVPAYHTAGVRRWYFNKRDERFCCRSHRDQSNEALRRFTARAAATEAKDTADCIARDWQEPS